MFKSFFICKLIIALALITVLGICFAQSKHDLMKSRFGALAVLPAPDGRDESVFTLNNHVFHHSPGKAYSYSFLRASTKAGPEYVVIDQRVPGLHCTNEYRIIKISSFADIAVSPVIADCGQITGVEVTKQGIKLTTENFNSVKHQYSWKGNNQIIVVR